MKIQYKLAVSVFALFIANLSLADVTKASLQEIQGNLVVDSGGSRSVGIDGAVLKVNDLVMVPADGGGKIVYENCSYVLKPKTVVKVLDGSCKFAESPYGSSVATTVTPDALASTAPGYKLANVIGVTAIVGGAAALAASGGSSGGSRDASAQ
jgi:hypothetical protein